MTASTIAQPLPDNGRVASKSLIPLGLKLLYSGFMLVLVPYYWHSYGATNFLWFCDVALLVTWVGIWTESRLLISTQAVAIVAPQLLWCAAFISKMVFGASLTGLADYMFNPEIPLFVRGLSLFHGWMPLLLLWLVKRVGYDRRALAVEVAIAWSVLIATYLIVPDPNGLAGNVNRVFGPDDKVAQTMMHPIAWLATLCVVYPVLIYIPSHLAFCFAVRKGWIPGKELARVEN